MFKASALNLIFQPTLLRAVGIFASQLGIAMIGAGFILHVLLQTTSKLKGIGQLSPPAISVQSILPEIFTWFIPESAEGFAFWLLIAALGLYCRYVANVLKRYYS